jgi:hypothetical protein
MQFESTRYQVAKACAAAERLIDLEALSAHAVLLASWPAREPTTPAADRDGWARRARVLGRRCFRCSPHFATPRTDSGP